MIVNEIDLSCEWFLKYERTVASLWGGLSSKVVYEKHQFTYCERSLS